MVVLSNYTIYRLASVGFAFIPFISDNITVRTIFVFIFASIYAVTGEMGYITFVNWRMTLVKKEDRTKFASSKNMIKNTVVMAFSLFMGVILDKFKANGYELNGFLILFGIVFIIAFIDIMIRINTYKPEIENKPITIKESISRPAKDKSFKKVLITAGINRFALGIGTMYLNVYLLRYLHINYVYYSILNIVINLSDALFSKFWARKADGREWKRVLIPNGILYIISFILLFVFKANYVIYLLPIIYVFMGCANSAYDIYDNVAIYESSKENYQTSYVTFERFIEGIVTAIIPILSYTVFKENENIISTTFLIAIIVYIVFIVYINKKYD